MQKYELAIVLKPLSNEEVKDKFVSKLEALVKTLGGNVGKFNYLGKRLLAYPVKKQKEGYYLFCKLEISRNSVKELDGFLNSHAEVLRSLRMKEDLL
jgi:small subunit ribosomal protein S6